jgi:2,4-didehydro-3-deoxy-L-rhamnonate hydrolase
VFGPTDDIAFDPELSAKWDYEAEAALVIGRDGRSIPEERAWDYVFGFCVADDVSQRDLQRAHGGQWLKGKSIDQTIVSGPLVKKVGCFGRSGGSWPSRLPADSS